MAGVVITAFVVSALYFGREILIPLALAALLSFLLSPLVARLERWIGRVLASLVAVAVLMGIIGGAGWLLTRQVIELATHLPDYKQNLQVKLNSLKVPGGNRFAELNNTVEELKNNFSPTQSGTAGQSKEPTATKSASPQAPMPVQVVDPTHSELMKQFGSVLSPLLSPLGTGALALLLAFCMLFQREDLRARLIRTLGVGNISATTLALDDAATRVSRYLRMQLAVNATFGAIIALGLFLIGVPNFLVWGMLATVLRFIPYVGIWIAALFPLLLSLAVTNSWMTPLFTIGLYLGVELICSNLMEPLLYGSSTGVSSIALILAAVFWTWIWGGAGLVLATPLTVCLVVMGRHIPRLSILWVLLSDEVPLAPHEEFYHRLVATNATGALDFSIRWLKEKENTPVALYDSVYMPALVSLENDLAANRLEREQHSVILQEMRDVIDDLGTRFPIQPKNEAGAEASPQASPPAVCDIVVAPLRATRDEIAGLMLTQLLQQNQFPVTCIASTMTTGEKLETIESEAAEVACISITPPSTIVQARHVIAKLREKYPKLRIVAGLWRAESQPADAASALREAGADDVAANFAEALHLCHKYASAFALEEEVHMLPPDEETRLRELQGSGLLGVAADPHLDKITKKLAHILAAPIALVTLVDKERQVFKSQTGLPSALAEARETTREVSICSHVVAANGALLVEDLARDRRFSKNSFIKENGLRSYAGVPLRTSDGLVIGALCIIDHKPRRFGEHEQRILEVLAEEAMDAMSR